MSGRGRLPCVFFWCLVGAMAPARATQPTSTPAPTPSLTDVDAERWIEIDLTWFDRENTLASTQAFWTRAAPLFRDVTGWRGIILNVGWVADPVLDWSGNLTTRIPIPAGMQPESAAPFAGPLLGDLSERQRQWKARFTGPISGSAAEHAPWTYEDLRRLASELRQVAESQQALAGVRVGIAVTGWESAFGGAKSAWASVHPEAFRGSASATPSINLAARLAADNRRYGAFPRGIPEGTPFAEVFASQWGHLSRAVGLDAIVLRDGLLLPGRTRRAATPADGTTIEPEAAAAWTQAAATLVNLTKTANPRALVIGFSSGGSAIADWRVDSVDLEAIAREGHLDAFIDQSRGGGWGEVGQREAVFWGRPQLGWTYQLAHILLHGAILAETRVRHYVLTETFDAWEAGDVIHTAPERLRWAIWAYHHAAVKRPSGLKMPAGTYVSWGNRGRQLLSEEDVAFLATHLNEAIRDARATQEVYGPTLVYNRAALESLMRNDPSRSIGEWLDDQAGTIAKWPVPILSATRVEHLPDIHTDLPILSVPNPLAARERDHIIDWIRSGRPTAIFASPAGGIDPEIARLAGIETQETRRWTPRREATVTAQVAGITDGVPATFATLQPFSRNTAVDGATPVLTVDGSPVLVVNSYGGKRVVTWDPPDIELDPPGEWRDRPLLDRLGSVYPYVTLARALTLWLRDSQSPFVERILPTSHVSLGAWRLADGRYRVLAAQLEEGLGEATDATHTIAITLPADWSRTPDGRMQRPLMLRDVWDAASLPDPGDALHVTLGAAQSRLFDLTPR
jgi:hypothetical protein